MSNIPEFRVWDGRCFLYSEYTELKRETGILVSHDSCCNPPAEAWEQFTGQYDATKWADLTEAEREAWTLNHMPSSWRGRKIFVGDIIAQSAFPNDAPSPQEIIFADGAYRRRYKNWDDTLPCPPLCASEITLMGYRVIGTIHDAPDLLK